MPKEYNKLSAQLQKKLPILAPGEKIRFELDSIYFDKKTRKLVCPRSVAINGTDRIWDPWAGKVNKSKEEYGHDGAFVDIGYILRDLPAPAASSRESILEFGRPKFLSETVGSITLIGGNAEHEKMLIIMFFNNKNSTNADKPWFVKPQGKLLFHQVTPKQAAKDKLARAYLIDQANALIKDMSDEEVVTAMNGLFPGTKKANDEDRRLKLRDLAAKEPKQIINLSESVGVRITGFIEELITEGLIFIDKTKEEIQWPDDKSRICTIKPGQTPHNSLRRYFETPDGVVVLKSLEKSLESTKKKEGDKVETAGVV